MRTRNRGTLVGNVAHGFPNADPPAALIAIGAQARIVGPGGSRALPIEDLFVGFMQTALARVHARRLERPDCLPERLRSARAMRVGALPLVAELGDRLLVTLREEHGVVAEAAATALLRGDGARKDAAL